MKKQKGPVVSVWLTIAQLHLTTGSVYKACDALKQLGDLQYRPGMVGTSFHSNQLNSFLSESVMVNESTILLKLLKCLNEDDATIDEVSI